ncbi:hypothetical protein K474DRAFT_1714087 [Panus rudis PR-1116 ss-1]|nr:hypothetical protein K474DRAFT_1714087 [Panus rudis PR-1116 ss-1]
MVDTVEHYRIIARLRKDGEPLEITLPRVHYATSSALKEDNAADTAQRTQNPIPEDSVKRSSSSGTAHAMRTRRSKSEEPAGPMDESATAGAATGHKITPQKFPVRQSHKMRMSSRVWWFDAKGIEPIAKPPKFPGNSNLQDYDLYIHRVLDDIQIWRYEPGEGGKRWVPLKHGESVEVPGVVGPRTFVMTPNGKPSYVSIGTVAKNYARSSG